MFDHFYYKYLFIKLDITLQVFCVKFIIEGINFQFELNPYSFIVNFAFALL
jgi:hypothetical protein